MKNSIDSKITPDKYLKLILNGFIIGIANVLPGVSGGTIAFIFGIYEDILFSIRSFNLNFLKLLLQLKFKEARDLIPIKFLSLLSLGLILAIVIFSRLLVWLIQNEPILINSFFFGLILATVPLMGKVIKKWSIFVLFSIILSILGTFYLLNMVPVDTPDSLWFIFLCGAISISAMILPGISGSFVLLILGKYFYIMDAINTRDLLILLIFLSGASLGLIFFVRLLSWLMNKYHDITIAILTGFVVGSLSKIWPWKLIIDSIQKSNSKIIVIKEINILPSNLDFHLYLAILLAVIGFFCALLIDRSAKIEP